MFKASDCDLDALEYWLVNRQMKLEGGFQGRKNKLVDACYSFWQGLALAVVEIVRQGGSDLYDMEMYFNSMQQADTSCHQSVESSEYQLSESNVSFVADDNGSLLFNQKALQRYILHCSQNIDGGGLRDKPGKHRDFYHTLVVVIAALCC